MRMLLKGVERHLHSPIDNVRILGMIVGENLMNNLNKFDDLKENSDNRKLKFDVIFFSNVVLFERKKIHN